MATGSIRRVKGRSHRDRLAEAVADRREELGWIAVAEQPAHLVGLLGPVPREHVRVERWRQVAARIESYREEWAVPLERLREAPTDLVQRAQWRREVQSSVSSIRLLVLQAAREIAGSRARSRSRGLER